MAGRYKSMSSLGWIIFDVSIGAAMTAITVTILLIGIRLQAAHTPDTRLEAAITHLPSVTQRSTTTSPHRQAA